MPVSPCPDIIPTGGGQVGMRGKWEKMFSKICSLENLLSAFYLARRGNRCKSMAMDFYFNLEGNISKLSWELSGGKYRPMPYKYFVVRDPKPRNIAAPHFRDRVVQHSLVSIIEPIFDKQFIYDSYACRKGKGTHFGLKRLKRFLQASRTFYGKEKEIYILQADIQKFFQNVSWDILLKIIEKTVKCRKTMVLIKIILETHEGYSCRFPVKSEITNSVDEKERQGIPIGNLTSQLFANVYLNEFDHFVKEKLRERWYGRYMDDFFVISDDLQHLKETREKIRKFLKNKLRLNFHPRKVSINKVKAGVAFVGYRVFYDHILIRGKTLLRMQKKLKIRRRQLTGGKIEPKNLNQTINSFKGHLKHANAYKLSKTLFKG